MATNRRASKRMRRDHEPPEAVAERGWRYHHLGIPLSEPRPGMTRLKRLKLRVSGFPTSPFGIEWMSFDPGCEVSDLVRRVPHIAFEVDDLDAAVRGRTLLGQPNSPSAGVRVAMIVDDGAPVELIEFRKRRPKAKTARRPR